MQKAGASSAGTQGNTLTGTMLSGSNPANGSSWAAATVVSSPLSGMSGSGNVHLSPFSSQLRASASDPSGDIDMARVAALRASIADGSYNVDPARIADGMLSSAQELF
ncbi:flagellar biosynthesis anti-sigma factor FlgM [Robbsia sp. Bb-Pol-6]|uniref:Negative regulator of flagellin synthesis n=2 Tax=Robbsia betulipollinis TaxID=2981849 RepID=A0ABT3ZHM1_9BURK|nr:flagellar biosynthesis anti-sigma factor FlgM [Robbsia betulipollinis]MCY0386019.1 flagellar biosynthesis anti-sigma factor FlgM [Robbsia betulipollinis]